MVERHFGITKEGDPFLRREITTEPGFGEVTTALKAMGVFVALTYLIFGNVAISIIKNNPTLFLIVLGSVVAIFFVRLMR